MDDKKKTFVIPEAEIIELFGAIDTIGESAGVNGWDDDDNVEKWGQQ